jgi:transposase
VDMASPPGPVGNVSSTEFPALFSLGQANTLINLLSRPGDVVLFRLIESWTENGKKRSRIARQFYGKLQDPGQTLVRPNWFAERITRGVEMHKANVFFGVLPRVDRYLDHAFQIRVVRVLWADLDHCLPDEALRRISEARLPNPTVVIRSGSGVHLYWMLGEPFLIDDAGAPPPVLSDKRGKYFIDPATGERVPLARFRDALSPKAQVAQQTLRGIAKAIGGDATFDLARLLRLPGTYNRKDERNGRTPVPCSITDYQPGRHYGFEEFGRFTLPEEPRRTKTTSEQTTARRRAAELARGGKSCREVAAELGVSPETARQWARAGDHARLVSTLAPAIKNCQLARDRSKADFALCCRAIREGFGEEDVWLEVQSISKFATRGREYFDLTWANATREVQETRESVNWAKGALKGKTDSQTPIDLPNLAHSCPTFSINTIPPPARLIGALQDNELDRMSERDRPVYFAQKALPACPAHLSCPRAQRLLLQGRRDVHQGSLLRLGCRSWSCPVCHLRQQRLWAEHLLRICFCRLRGKGLLFFSGIEPDRWAAAARRLRRKKADYLLVKTGEPYHVLLATCPPKDHDDWACSVAGGYYDALDAITSIPRGTRRPISTSKGWALPKGPPKWKRRGRARSFEETIRALREGGFSPEETSGYGAVERSARWRFPTSYPEGELGRAFVYLSDGRVPPAPGAPSSPLDLDAALSRLDELTEDEAQLSDEDVVEAAERLAIECEGRWPDTVNSDVGF